MAKKLIGNQSRIDMNKNGRIDAEDFKILRSSMNGAYRNERKHVNHNEDYEIRYAKPRPKRTGYKGKRAFDDGGTIDAFTIRVVKGTSGKPNEIISDPQEIRFRKGGSVKNERLHVNHSEDYEVRYAKPRPSRKGYKGKRRFNDGGNIPLMFLVKKGDVVIAEFKNEEDAKDFIYEYELEHPRVNLELVNPNFIPKFSKKYVPENRLSESEWMMKHNSSREARAYDGGGAVKEWRKGSSISFKTRQEANRRLNLMKNHDESNTEYKNLRVEKTDSGYSVKFDFKDKMLTGGKVTFKEKARAIAKKFEAKRVEPKYQKEYGKVYDKAEAKEVGNKIAGSQKAKYDAKAEKGAVVKKGKGNHKMKATTELARKIRRDGEKWTDAIKRASEQIKNK